jgi:hypothetical protein
LYKLHNVCLAGWDNTHIQFLSPALLLSALVYDGHSTHYEVLHVEEDPVAGSNRRQKDYCDVQ